MSAFEEKVSKLRKSGTFFSESKPVYISRAPGRLDLMGGNVDYTGGLVFQATIREATWAAAQGREDGRIAFWNPQMQQEGWEDKVNFELAGLTDEETVRKLVNQRPQVRWTAYVLGVFYLLQCKYPGKVRTGASVYIESDVPLNKGVSSSAAIEVAVMKAVSAAYGIPLAGVELAELCQWVENVIAESACGIMDQAASVLGDEGYVLPLVCQPCSAKPLVKLPTGLRCWGIDSGVRHAVTGIEYEAARAGAFIGFRMICDRENLPVSLDSSGRIPRFVEPRWNGYISNILPSVFRSCYENELPLQIAGAEILKLGREHIDPYTTVRPEVNYRVRACTRYAVEENQRIELFVDLARGAADHHSEITFRLMGDLMFQSHWSYTECGLGCEATDQLVELVRAESATGELYGAKITGGGGGGTVAVLGSENAGEAFRRVLHKYAKLRGNEPYVFEGSSMGADRFGLHVLRTDA
ncbi:MAG TPA: galactokinase family protein [Candidatus Sulfotelmatobacter sp.]|nr:galactokinase family protein [Candidatus Sulfotelmatobacter sp.]